MTELQQNLQTLPEHSGNDIVLYDGVCSLCNFSVQFILPRDSKGRFHFASLQSDFARQILTKYGRDANELITFYVLAAYGTAQERLMERSQAALYTLSHLDGAWSACSILQIVPKPIADAAYNAIASNRYALFGKHQACMLAQPGFADRFIEQSEARGQTLQP